MPTHEAFFIKLTNNDPLDKDFNDYEKLRRSGFDKQQALKKLQIKTVPPSGLVNYNYLRETWKKSGMTLFEDFLLQIKTVPPSGLVNYNYLRENWKKSGITLFEDFLQ